MLTESIPPALVWLLSAVLVEAAVIDGRQLRVPNWLTFHLAIGGLGYWAYAAGGAGLAAAAGGLAVGLALLLPLYAIGGMGAGDVKLLAGVGAWIGPWAVLGAFGASAIVGGVLAVGLILRAGAWRRHTAQLASISREIVTVRDPARLSEAAAARKPTMLLLPYGIPLAIGTIGYFACTGMLG